MVLEFINCILQTGKISFKIVKWPAPSNITQHTWDSKYLTKSKMQAFFQTLSFLGIKVLCRKEMTVFSFSKHFMKSEKFFLFCGVGVGQFLEFSNSISKKRRRRRRSWRGKKKNPIWTKGRRTYFTFFFFWSLPKWCPLHWITIFIFNDISSVDFYSTQHKGIG